MFIGLLSAGTLGSFGESLGCNFEEHLKCIYLKNRPCQAKTTFLIKSLTKLFFIHLLLVLISVVEVLTLLMIHMLEYVFQIKEQI